MTILNEVAVRGMAVDFLDKHKRMRKARWWYYLSWDGKVGAIVRYDDGGRGAGGLCMVEHKNGNLKAAGYMLPLSDIRAYKNQCQKDKRSF